ncbi:MAG TPA: DUF3794 domain-containing protein [Clostridiales bacterium]|nr:DUF3794 domain-containing protein [Clostridiales bacterium]
MSEIDTKEYLGPLPPPPPKPPKKTIQVPVILGKGEKQHLVVKESMISPPSPPIFRIKDVDKYVVITQAKLVPSVNYDDCYDDKDYDQKWWLNKVIINGYVDKNVNYKTITDFTCEDVNGPVYHFTTRAYFSTFVEIKTKEKVKDCDKVEILSAVVEGEKEDLLDPNPPCKGAPDWAVTYNKLLEKILVKISAKIIRIEEVKVQPEY